MTQASAPFSFRLKMHLRTELERQADMQERSTSFVAQEAIEQYLQGKKMKQDAIKKALEQADTGVFVSSDQVHSWMQSWGTDDETTAPEADIFVGCKGASGK
ncbi:hypothetical protein MK079_04960 [Candidatus Gracilibacteria bacterium]|nr:hypothetical protein [Candidatus Gracilibacteria bacterium]